jgi:THAP4-like, heme-binding beta-barrel domain
VDGVLLHREVEPIRFLLGKWAGEGEGRYPTIEPFRYGEEMFFSHVGKPFIAYSQRSWHLEDGRPLHAEMGYLRCTSPTTMAVVVAHPTGHAELSEGDIKGCSVECSSSGVLRSSGSKEVRTLVRRVWVERDLLEYELDMAAVSMPLSTHLRGALRRVAGP